MSADGVGCSPLPCLGRLFTHDDDDVGGDVDDDDDDNDDDDAYTIMFMSYIQRLI